MTKVTKLRVFSLIELIVAVSVLAVLSSLLFPSISRALIASKGVHCMNNMNVLSSSFHMYADDYSVFTPFRMARSTSNDPRRNHTVFYDDMLGSGYDGRSLTQKQMDKSILLGDEANGAEMYACPLDETGIRDTPVPSSMVRVSNGQQIGKPRTYSINSNRSQQWVREADKQGMTGVQYQSQEPGAPWHYLTWSRGSNQVNDPSQLFLLVESPGEGFVGSIGAANTRNPNDQFRLGYYNRLRSQGVDIDDPLQQYHNGGWNYLFVDGHVENLIPIDTIGATGALNGPRGYWTNNPND